MKRIVRNLIKYFCDYFELDYKNYQQLQMSYFQKYQKLCNHSKMTNHTSDSFSNEHNSTAEFQQNGQSRHSYLKAFKKYYIDKLVNQQDLPSPIFSQQNKQNFCFHEPQKDKSNSTFNHQKSIKETENLKKMIANDRKISQQSFAPKISNSKVTEMVSSKQNQLQELIYNSISQMERQVMSFGENSQLVKQNKMLRASIEKMKLILKQKLKEALTKNKQELTIMFDQYSGMIKKLLQDKEKLTGQLQNYKLRLTNEENAKKAVEANYENQIRLIIEQNNNQISNTKQQIEQFLDMIIQYEEEANNQKVELEKLRQKIIDLEMENDKLKKEINSDRSRYVSTRKMRQSDSEREEISMSKESNFSAQRSQSGSFENSRDKQGQISHKYVTDQDSDQEDLNQIQRYAQKIENLLDMLDKLQEQNKQLNEFLKSCNCSRIKCKKMENSKSDGPSSEELKRQYEKKMIQAQKDFIREEMCLREAIKKKDQCIDRLSLVIEEMRKARYQSVDRITIQALKKPKK